MEFLVPASLDALHLGVPQAGTNIVLGTTLAGASAAVAKVHAQIEGCDGALDATRPNA